MNKNKTKAIQYVINIIVSAILYLASVAVLAILLTVLGEKLNVDIYLAAIVVFVGRMFTNLAIIRRHYIDKWVNAIETKKAKKQEKSEDVVEEKV